MLVLTLFLWFFFPCIVSWLLFVFWLIAFLCIYPLAMYANVYVKLFSFFPLRLIILFLLFICSVYTYMVILFYLLYTPIFSASNCCISSILPLCSCYSTYCCVGWVIFVIFYHHHISVMELGHLLTRSVLTYPEISSKVCHDSFCQLGNSVSLPWVIYYGAFYLHVVSSFSYIPVVCLKLGLFLIP